MATTYKTFDGEKVRAMTEEEIAALQLAHDEVEAREQQEALHFCTDCYLLRSRSNRPQMTQKHSRYSTQCS
jgi:hypothetical protein